MRFLNVSCQFVSLSDSVFANSLLILIRSAAQLRPREVWEPPLQRSGVAVGGAKGPVCPPMPRNILLSPKCHPALLNVLKGHNMRSPGFQPWGKGRATQNSAPEGRDKNGGDLSRPYGAHEWETPC